jgi:hypothetical protein
MKSALKLLCAALFLAALVSCGGGGGKAIKPGTPAFFWVAATDAWKSGDYLRSSEQLSKLTTSDNEYRARATAWQMIVSSGLTIGYLEFIEAYDAGAKANKERAIDFRKQASTARSQAKGIALQSVEAMHYFGDNVKDPKVGFDFAFPTGSLGDVPGLVKVANGTPILAADADTARRAALQKGVLKMVCRAIGAQDPAKAAEMLKQPPVEVPRETFLFAMAEALNDMSALFGPKQLDDPPRLKVLLDEALEMVQQLAPSKQTKDLEAKIQKVLKPGKK